MPRIDAHHHFWQYNKEQHGWINDEMESIRRDFLPANLEPQLVENIIDGVVTVQVDHSTSETNWLLELAAAHTFIKGVVGWVDFKKATIEGDLDKLAANKKLKGLRHIVQAEPDGFLLQSEFLKGITALSKRGLTYDILVYPHQLPEAIKFVKHFPNQKFVLDHLAKPFIAKHQMQPWKKDITELAKNENVFCKLSGMVTEADWKEWDTEHFTPYVDTVLEAFGANRLLYGSDWPVCLVAASYFEQLDLVESCIDRLSLTEKQKIMGDNAVQFYNL
jgi:L-fuconolactonase